MQSARSKNCQVDSESIIPVVATFLMPISPGKFPGVSQHMFAHFTFFLLFYSETKEGLFVAPPATVQALCCRPAGHSYARRYARYADNERARRGFFAGALKNSDRFPRAQQDKEAIIIHLSGLRCAPPL